jgi:two-component system NtrC family response regulator
VAKKTLIVADVGEAHELICKDRSFEEYRFAEDNALDRRDDSKADVRGAHHGLEAISTFQGMVGHSSALLQVLELAVRAARSNCTVLIQGETGTGKELLAPGIHANSKRANKAFVTLNCGAIPKELFESELFGHLQGSFTGAVRNRTGKAEAANFGTLFLEEIGEMPLDLQVKLLRLIQEGEIETVGATAPTKLDIRIIAATNRNLPALVQKRKFREDLYHRLNVIPLEMPNLRERAEDIPELVRYFFERSCARHQRDSLLLSASILDRFAAYSWPGSIRELKNAIERIVVLAPGREVQEKSGAGGGNRTIRAYSFYVTYCKHTNARTAQPAVWADPVYKIMYKSLKAESSAS